jgi:MarR family transcriptional regulator, organic hydroperoxide resistance regulator
VPTKPASTPSAELHLSEHLPYLFKHIHSQLQVASAGRLAQFGVNVAVWRILAVLWEHGELSHRELADLTSIEVSTLSRISKSVQREGLIRRTRTQEDQRTVRVTLTERGRTLTQAIIPSALDTQSDIVGNLSAADVKNLTRILHVIVENLSRYATVDSDIVDDSADSNPSRKGQRAVAKRPKSRVPNLARLTKP